MFYEGIFQIVIYDFALHTKNDKVGGFMLMTITHVGVRFWLRQKFATNTG